MHGEAKNRMLLHVQVQKLYLEAWHLEWVNCLWDFGYSPSQPIRLYCDNKATYNIAHNLVQHGHTKHVEVNRFFIKEKLDEQIVGLPNIQSEDQLADIFTKVVLNREFSKFLNKLEMCDIYTPTYRDFLKY